MVDTREMDTPMNNATVRNPQWTGDPGEYAIVVCPGEPRRNPVEMTRWVRLQIEGYLQNYTDMDLTDSALDVVTQAIISDRTRIDGQIEAIMLTREHLVAYVASMGSGHKDRNQS